MKVNSGRTALTELWRTSRSLMFFFFLISAVNFSIFRLYSLDMEPFFYAWLMTFVFGIIFLTVRYVRIKAVITHRKHSLFSEYFDPSVMPEASSSCEADYQEKINELIRQIEKMKNSFDQERTDMIDYYTTWVHQIKTPIAVMKFQLEQDDSQTNRALKSELFRVEQYVEMVLQYLRLGSETNDLVVGEYEVNDLVRESVRKFAPQFISRKLTMDCRLSGEMILTDRKWFACIMDQLLSNAVKYTQNGGVTILFQEGILTIKDTGIGIAPEDLPRIFEKGYTGANGRIGMKSSGLGLYLCKKACDLLSIPIAAESTPGSGTTFLLDCRKTRVRE